MLETLDHAPITMRSRACPQSFDVADGTEITLVQDKRGRVENVLTQDECQNVTTIQMAFNHFASDANKLPGPYDVEGYKLSEEDGVYRIEVTKQCGDDGFDNGGTSTLVDIKLDVDGIPHWEPQGPKLDNDFHRRLDDLISYSIAEALRAA